MTDSRNWSIRRRLRTSWAWHRLPTPTLAQASPIMVRTSGLPLREKPSLQPIPLAHTPLTGARLSVRHLSLGAALGAQSESEYHTQPCCCFDCPREATCARSWERAPRPLFGARFLAVMTRIIA